jgi:hypothetical protein
MKVLGKDEVGQRSDSGPFLEVRSYSDDFARFQPVPSVDHLTLVHPDGLEQPVNSDVVAPNSFAFGLLLLPSR